MKYIKTYEELKEPEIGDYVYCECDEDVPSKYIGLLTDISTGEFPGRYPYRVEYPLDNPDDLDHHLSRKNIISWAKTPEELEHYMKANKFNI